MNNKSLEKMAVDLRRAVDSLNKLMPKALDVEKALHDLGDQLSAHQTIEQVNKNMEQAMKYLAQAARPGKSKSLCLSALKYCHDCGETSLLKRSNEKWYHKHNKGMYMG